MKDKKLSKASNVRKWLLDCLSEENCIQIIKDAGLNLDFKELKVKRTVFMEKEELRLGGKEVLRLVPIPQVIAALKLNNSGIYSKAKYTNQVEFADKCFVLRGDEGKVHSITPKGVILYCLCTHGNHYVNRVDKKVYKFLYSQDQVVEDPLSDVFKRIS